MVTPRQLSDLLGEIDPNTDDVVRRVVVGALRLRWEGTDNTFVDNGDGPVHLDVQDLAPVTIWAAGNWLDIFADTVNAATGGGRHMIVAPRPGTRGMMLAEYYRAFPDGPDFDELSITTKSVTEFVTVHTAHLGRDARASLADLIRAGGLPAWSR